MSVLPKVITNVLNQRGEPLVPRRKRKFNVTGTSIIGGDPEFDVYTEWAFTLEEAGQQALDHAVGTSFKVEKVELANS